MKEALEQLRAAMLLAVWPSEEVKDATFALVNAIESESDQAGFITDKEVAEATKELEETLSDLDEDDDDDEDEEDEFGDFDEEEDEDG